MRLRCGTPHPPRERRAPVRPPPSVPGRPTPAATHSLTYSTTRTPPTGSDPRSPHREIQDRNERSPHLRRNEGSFRVLHPFVPRYPQIVNSNRRNKLSLNLLCPEHQHAGEIQPFRIFPVKAAKGLQQPRHLVCQFGGFIPAFARCCFYITASLLVLTSPMLPCLRSVSASLSCCCDATRELALEITVYVIVLERRL